jgi:hypothetical protein
MPATTLPTIGVMGAAVPTQIPEIALAKKTDQRGVAKISLFAYNRETGRPVWQSGAVPEQSTTKAFWLLGAGPFQRGTIHRGTTFAGAKLHIPLIDPAWADDGKHAAVAVADEAFFVEPKEPPSSSAKPPVAGTPGKDQSSPATAAAAKPADAPTATASPTAATTPPPASPATATAPVVPNRQIDRIGDVPTGPPPGATGPAPAADFRPAAPPSTPEVSPTGAIMPFGPFSTPMTPSEETFRGDTWLDRRR